MKSFLVETNPRSGVEEFHLQVAANRGHVGVAEIGVGVVEDIHMSDPL